MFRAARSYAHLLDTQVRYLKRKRTCAGSSRGRVDAERRFTDGSFQIADEDFAGPRHRKGYKGVVCSKSFGHSLHVELTKFLSGQIHKQPWIGPLDATKHIKKKSMSSKGVGKREAVNNPEVVITDNLVNEPLGKLDWTEISSRGTTWMHETDYNTKNGAVANTAYRGAHSDLEISESDFRQIPSSVRPCSVGASEAWQALFRTRTACCKGNMDNCERAANA